MNVLSNATHENWSDVYVIHPEVILDDSQERITTASSVFESHSAKWRTRGLVAASKSIKPGMNLYYTFTDPRLFSTCFFIFWKGKLIIFDEGIWAWRLAPSLRPLWMSFKRTILPVNAKQREKWVLNESQVLHHGWLLCVYASWEEDLW